MSCHRILAMAAVGTAATLWAYGCGDGATDPTPTPTPDPPRPTTVTVTPAGTALTALGATAQLSAEVRDQNGRAMAGASVAWASGAAAVATVSAGGLVTAAGNGTATITATAGSASGTATVTVAQEVRALTVTPAADTLLAFGDTLRLSAEAADANGNVVEGSAFTWASSDTLVAVVDSAGLVRGNEPGEIAVTATASGVSGHADLTVASPVPTTLAVTPDTVAFTAIGQTVQFGTEVLDQAGRAMQGVAVSWSSADTAVAVVDSLGLVTAERVGSTTVTATAGEASGEAVVTVMQSAGRVAVTPAADTLAPGDTLRLIAEAFDENGHRVDGAEFIWSSNYAAVATVNTAGLVMAMAEGTVTITAAAGDARGTSEITVANPDRAALEALYNATDGPNWVDNNNWLTDAPLGEWYGVDTDASGRIVRLDLSGSQDLSAPGQPVEVHGLSGSIPRELGRLGSLRVLDLGYNDLSGSIPTELGNLGKLTELHLQRNRLYGSIPIELGNLEGLTDLQLSFNDLSGQIPPQLGSLGELENLFLTSNTLSGSIPPELGEVTSLEILDLAHNHLSGPIPPSLGNLASLWRLALYNNKLTDPIPAELANLDSLRQLWLRDNYLSGSLPPELGDLGGLTAIDLRNNSLSGPIPVSFLQLGSLRSFRFGGNAGLCAPGTSAFANWMERIENRDEAPYCNEADAAALELLYNGTNGPSWTNSDAWLSDRAMGEWYGIKADSLGRVTDLDLASNGLEGQLPGDLGDLVRMTVLRISDNALSGRLPQSLARLSLEELHYAGTELCAPPDDAFRRWLGGIASHEGTGVECAPLSDREILEIFYQATGGPDWTNNDNWLTDAPLRQWYGVYADGEDKVVSLVLYTNNLKGTIPPELGNLANLTRLGLNRNALSGLIPPELGSLTSLETLRIFDNDLSGPIPPELGNLAGLETVGIGTNNLTGSIPPEPENEKLNDYMAII